MPVLGFSHLVICPVEDLSVLTITSKALREVVELYLSTEIANKRILRETVTHSLELDPPLSKRYMDQFQRYGK
jgi:hypothetical protein